MGEKYNNRSPCYISDAPVIGYFRAEGGYDVCKHFERGLHPIGEHA